MSFFHRDPPKNNEEYIAREREGDRKRREKFLKEQEAAKAEAEIRDSPHVDNDPSTPTIDYSGAVTGHDKERKKGIRERVEDFQLKQRLKREEKELKAFQKKKNKQAKKERGLIEQEKKVYGRELTADERHEYFKYKEEKRAKQQENKEKLKKRVGQLRKEVGGLGSLGGNYSFGGGSSDNGILSGSNILDVNRGLGAEKSLFEANFGSLLIGKKGKKKLKKHPLSI